MASAPAWQPALAEQSYQLVAQRVALASPHNLQIIHNVLKNSARIKSSSDFARVTKSGRRTTTNSMIGYLYLDSPTNEKNPAKLGLIIGKSVGSSVKRHRIARQIRHAFQESNFQNGTLFVVRVMKQSENAFYEAKELMTKTIKHNSKPKLNA